MATKKKAAANKVREGFLKWWKKETRTPWADLPQPDPSQHSSSWCNTVEELLCHVNTAVEERDVPDAFRGEAVTVRLAVTGAELRDIVAAGRILPAALRYSRSAMQRVQLLEAESAWRPMAAAPKDGRRILVCDPANPRPVIARYLTADEQFPSGMWVLDTDSLTDFQLMDTWVWRGIPCPPAPLSAPKPVEGGA